MTLTCRSLFGREHVKVLISLKSSRVPLVFVSVWRIQNVSGVHLIEAALQYVRDCFHHEHAYQTCTTL